MNIYGLLGGMLLAAATTVNALSANAITVDEINTAAFALTEAPHVTTHGKSSKVGAASTSETVTNETRKTATKKGPDARVIKAQVLLDRRRLSPGVIDGYDGDNFRKAMAELRRLGGLPDAEGLDAPVWTALGADATRDIMTEYTVTAGDVAYPFAQTPKDYADLAKLKMIGYRTAAEMIGERFHMDEELVRVLNPTIENWREGDRLTVTMVRSPMPSLTDAKKKSGLRVKRILVERGRGAVTAFDARDRVLAIYPATVGSAETPTPAGHYTVKGVAHNPTYAYRPDVNFKQGKNTQKLLLPPGPNGPVGSVWIALSKPTYGIHGTPEPSVVSKTASHGCVRLTNWDAEDLASMTKTGVNVEFVD